MSNDMAQSPPTDTPVAAGPYAGSDVTADEVDPPTSSMERIVAAAETCFARFGFHKTSMEDIAREADLSRRSVYRYFPDKAALFREVVERRTVFYLDEIARRAARADGLSAQIEEVARLMHRMVREDPISVALHLTDPDSLARTVSTESLELVRMAMDAVIPLIEAARGRGEVRADLDAPRAAEWIARMIFSLAATPSATFDIDDPEEVAEFIREFLVPGLS